MHRSPSPISLAAGAAMVLALVALPIRAIGPSGPEFQVSTYTSHNQRHPRIASETDGDFVVVWESFGQDGVYYGVFAKRFTSSGAAIGAEFQVNTYTMTSQRYPTVAMDADGDFVVVWDSINDGITENVFAQRFSSSGAALDGEFMINVPGPGFVGKPSVATSADGAFVAAWQFDDKGAGGIAARRFSSVGTAVEDPFQVNTFTQNSQAAPAVAADAAGNFVVAWTSSYQDGSVAGVFAQLFNSGGPLGAELQANTYTPSNQKSAAVAMDALVGNFVVVWQSFAQAAPGLYGVFAQRFTNTGAPIGGEMQVASTTSPSKSSPGVAMNGNGDFVVIWTSYGGDGSATAIFAKRFSSAGAALSSDFQVNTYTPGNQRFAAVTIDASGSFVVAWESTRDSSGDGVFAQRFAPNTIDIGGNGELEALTDGLLLLRWLFGFTGATLTTGAVDMSDCTRCTAPDIEMHLQSLAD